MKNERFDRIEAYLHNTLPEPERRAFETELLTDPTLQSDMEIQQKLHLGLRALAIEKKLIEARYRTIQPAATTVVRPLSNFQVWRIAASILVVVGVGWGVWQFRGRIGDDQMVVLAEQEMVDVRYKSMPFDSLQKLTTTAPSVGTREKAEWYVALAYVKKGRKTEARELLTKIAKNPQHTYQQKAEKLLKKGI